MRDKRKARYAIAAAAICVCGGMSQAADVSATWIGATGNWTDPANWSSNPAYPNNGMLSYDAQVSSPTANVNINTPITIEQFTLSDGRLSGSDTLTTNDTLTWAGGIISGNGSINVNFGMQLAGAYHGFSGFAINIDAAATASWTGGYIYSVNGAGGMINNAGLWDDVTDQPWTWSGAAAPVFNNNGEFRKSADFGGIQKLQPVFNNDGDVNVQVGDLWLAGGGISSGSFTVDSFATLRISDYAEVYGGAGAGSTNFLPGSVIDSLGAVVFTHDIGSAQTEVAGTYDAAYTVIDPGAAGRVLFAEAAAVATNYAGDMDVLSGVVEFETGFSIFIPNVLLSGGEVYEHDDLFLDTLTWDAGTVRGDVSATVSVGDMTISGPAVKTLVDVVIFNGIGATSRITGGDLELQFTDIVNLQDASFDIRDDVALRSLDPNFSSRFFNGGVLVKSLHGGVGELIDVELYNDAAVDVQAGTLRLAGGGDHLGTFTIAGGATLEMGQSSWGFGHTLQSSAAITGSPGSTLHISGMTTLTPGSSADVDRLLVKGFLDLSGTIEAEQTTIGEGGFAFVGGGILSTTGAMIIGDTGAGDAAMSAIFSAAVSNDTAVVADGPGTAANARVSLGATWTNTQSLTIGNYGSGSMTIENTGLVTSTVGYIARYAGSDGLVVVGNQPLAMSMPNTPLAVGTESAWIMSDALFVGGDETAAGGVGQLVIESDGNVVAPLRTRVWDAGHIQFNAGSFSTGTLELVNGGSMTLGTGGDKVVRTTGLSIDAASVLDLSDNDMIIDYGGSAGSLENDIRLHLQNGRITSSAAAGGTKLGYGDNAALGRSELGGIGVDADSMLIKFTYAGDANLDGQVTISDLGDLASNWQSTSAVWRNGDFNYDGMVTISDLGDLASNWQAGVGNPLGMSFAEALAAIGFDGAAVPEPAAMGLLGLLGACTLKRARRKSAA